jgi:hypothetical protein
MLWHTRKNQISSFGETEESIYIGGGRQFSRLLAAEVCESEVVMLDTPCSEVVWRVLATHSIRQFPLHFPFRASLCAITFQLDSTFLHRSLQPVYWTRWIHWTTFRLPPPLPPFHFKITLKISVCCETLTFIAKGDPQLVRIFIPLVTILILFYCLSTSNTAISSRKIYTNTLKLSPYSPDFSSILSW